MFRALRIYTACAIVLLVWTGSAIAQSTTDRDNAAKQAVAALRRREVPEATLPCTPDEAKWWNDLRAAGKAVRGNRLSRKAKEKFLALLKEGRDKSYQVPIEESGARFLLMTEPEYTEEARNKRIRGSVALVVELLPDGTVGDARVIQGLDPGLDQKALEAARKLIFLPKVKERKFVSFFTPMTMSFEIF
jgi:TonB family protein